jgi:hypothetical protein
MGKGKVRAENGERRVQGHLAGELERGGRLAKEPAQPHQGADVSRRSQSVDGDQEFRRRVSGRPGSAYLANWRRW